MTDILDKMLLKQNNKLQPNRSLYIYSGHDVTLVNTMRALDIVAQTSRKPDYGSALYFELHQNPSLEKDMEVKVSWANVQQMIANFKLKNIFSLFIDFLWL